MRRTITAAATAALALGLTAGPAVAKGGPPEAENTIVDVAIAVNSSGDYAGEFDTLIGLLTDRPELLSALDGRRQFTVFAPTDGAFEDLFAFAADNNIELTPELVTDVLLYHVAPGERDSSDVVASSQIRTLSKQFIPIGGDGGLIGNADPVLLDVEASNGIIHVIDAVLLP